MNVYPSENQRLDLRKYEKLFVRYAAGIENHNASLYLKVNPAMIENEYIHLITLEKGLAFVKIFDNFKKPELFDVAMDSYFTGIFTETCSMIENKLFQNKSLVGDAGLIRFPSVNLCIFPLLKHSEVNGNNSSKEMLDFIDKYCIFADEFKQLRNNFVETFTERLNASIYEVSSNVINVGPENINSILNKIVPEYTIIRPAELPDEKSEAGVERELLVIDKDDRAVRAFHLDEEQINIVNKMTKGEQLVLACAGSGKSVLLIAKCFKAARMNPKKKFLLTCYNRNLYTLYQWYIDQAGFKERNVECKTYDRLCVDLLKRNNKAVPYGDNNTKYDIRRRAFINHLRAGNIADRYYGIFIDEVQIFEQEWYKSCFDLLENKNSDEHIFVICGDKTQGLKRRQKQGKAPWNAGENYPKYRGGNKSIRIEKNYRNCIEINEYINRFTIHAKQLLSECQQETGLDPDLFLRGQSYGHGIGVKLIEVKKPSNSSEAKAVIDSIHQIHDEYNIPYDEIAVVMFNKKYPAKIGGWSSIYNLGGSLTKLLKENRIPYSKKYSDEFGIGDRYGTEGVSLISFESVLGLDFRAVIVSGLLPLGHYDKTKNFALSELDSDEDFEKVECLNLNIKKLYVACTRAKESLHIIKTEDRSESIYIDLLMKAVE